MLRFVQNYESQGSLYIQNMEEFINLPRFPFYRECEDLGGEARGNFIAHILRSAGVENEHVRIIILLLYFCMTRKN